MYFFHRVLVLEQNCQVKQMNLLVNAKLVYFCWLKIHCPHVKDLIAALVLFI